MKPSQTMNDGRFALRFDSEGALEIDYVSLFPQETFHNRPNGLRKDVAQFVADLKPAFMRWPGGCFADEYHWKDGIGPKQNRKKMINTHWGGVTEDTTLFFMTFTRTWLPLISSPSFSFPILRISKRTEA